MNNFPRPSSSSIQALNSPWIVPSPSDLIELHLAMGSVASLVLLRPLTNLFMTYLSERLRTQLKRISVFIFHPLVPGNVEAIDFIKDHIDSDDTHIRSKALLSLRHMKGDKALIFQRCFSSGK